MKKQPKATLTGVVMIGVVIPVTAQDNSGDTRKRMNIVYIMSDDHSYQTISAYDRRFIETPNIDWIANNGVRALHQLVCRQLAERTL